MQTPNDGAFRIQARTKCTIALERTCAGIHFEGQGQQQRGDEVTQCMPSIVHATRQTPFCSVHPHRFSSFCHLVCSFQIVYAVMRGMM